jgi:hypothetical protein
MGDHCQSERVDLRPFMSRGSSVGYVGYVASRPDKNRIGLHRRQWNCKQVPVCQEKTVRRSVVQPHGVLRYEIKLDQAAQNSFDVEERG